MKRLKLSLLALFIISLSAYAASTITWKIDGNHSNIQFIATHMKISEVQGKFENYTGTIKTDGKDFETADISFTIDVNSINTGNSDRDDHLVKKDFFYAEKYPKIKFKSSELEKVEEMENGKTKYKLIGDLTMRGETQEEEFTAIHNGTVVSPWGKKKSGWKITGTVNRYDYGIKWDKTTQGGELVVGKKVDIVCDIELSPKK